MKNKFYNLFIFFVLTALASCNEKESTDVIEQGDPQIIEFTPTSGKFWTGNHYQRRIPARYTKATIGGVEASDTPISLSTGDCYCSSRQCRKRENRSWYERKKDGKRSSHLRLYIRFPK